MIRLALALALLALPAFAQTPIQNEVPLSVVAIPGDVANLYIFRYQNNPGGTPGYVAGTMRMGDLVYPGVTSNEWTITGIMLNYSSTGQQVAGYFQAHSFANGSNTWATVGENFCSITNSTCVDMEGDIGGVAGTNLVGWDCVNTSPAGGAVPACFRCQPMVPCVVDSDPTLPNQYAYTRFDNFGHYQLVRNGAVVQSW